MTKLPLLALLLSSAGPGPDAAAADAGPGPSPGGARVPGSPGVPALPRPRWRAGSTAR